MTEAESQEAESQTQDRQAQDGAGTSPVADSPEPGLTGGFVEDFVGDFERRYPARILETLLADRTTGRNIIWADNEYEALGDGYMGDDEITVDKISGANSGVIKPRIAKEAERQSQRTKSRAEVFTPSWLCNQMNNDLDEVWFGRRDVFNTEVAGEDGRKTWAPAAGQVAFPTAEGRDWRAYVAAPRLEITCGEAPFICSRYDTVTGQALPVDERIGFLDRKLRVVSERTKKRKTWAEQALAALKATYGFEYQGDNLLIARVNVFETFCEHLRERWDEEPTDEELEQAAQVVSWNLWQMDGFTDAVPTHELGAVAQSMLTPEQPAPVQETFFDLLFGDDSDDAAPPGAETQDAPATVPLCVLYDWENDRPFEFAALKGRSAAMTHSTAQHRGDSTR